MKGIILAGGRATRLEPATKAISKQILPVYDKPMIYYPLSTLMLTGIKDVLVISTPRDLPMFKSLLEDGSELGMNFSYKVQDKPRGLADAFRVGKRFIGDDSVALILGDNIFHGHGLPELLNEASSNKTGATVFGYRVSDPERYGVVEFDKNGKAVSLEEKPAVPKSNYAVVGLYFYDNSVVKRAANLKPSKRGELEITDLNRTYLEQGNLEVKIMGSGFAWLDTGTFDSLSDASDYVRAIQKRQGSQICCPEEIAYKKGFIDAEGLKRVAEPQKNSGYGSYLLGLLDE